MDAILTLRRQRGYIKAKVTRLEKKIDPEKDALGSPDREEIEECMDQLESIRHEFNEIQGQIVTNTTGELSASDAAAEAEFEDRYFDFKVILKRCLKKMPAQITQPTSTTDDALIRVLQQQTEIIQQIGQQNGGAGHSQQIPTDGNNDAITRLVEQQTELLRRFSDTGGATGQDSRVRLPVVKLPTFDGRTEEWKRFSDTFQSLIHSNASIPNIQKFQYLVSSLCGNAAKVIESIQLTGGNYMIAWELLTKRYEDPRAIKKKHIQCPFMMPRVEKESASAIRGLVDYTKKHIRILNSMNLPTDSWDELVIHMIETKLDTLTLRAWEQEGNPEAAELETLTAFLDKRCQMLERIEARAKERDDMRKNESEKQQGKTHGQTKKSQPEKSTTLATSSENGKCYSCHGEHFLYHCDKFLAMPVEDRLKEVRRLKLCINCFRNDHFVKTCKMGSCKECSGRHNTLCHIPTGNNDRPERQTIIEPIAGSSTDKTSSNVAVHHASNWPLRRQVLMATATVIAVRCNGASVPIRILLDSASEANFITHSACSRLGVKRDRTSEVVTGLNDMESRICQSADIVLQSKLSNFRISVHCLVVPNITKNLPSVEIDKGALQILSNLQLADPEFYKTSSVDMLIGAEFFFDLLDIGRISLGENRPVLQNTKFGWIIAGSVPIELARARGASLICNHETITTLNCSLEHCESLNRNLEKFWEIENYQSVKTQPFSEKERECEEFFDRTTTRDKNGRFVVRLPFREDPSKLGKSREIATKRLSQLERRFKRNDILHKRYAEFMHEYLELGHMSLISSNSRNVQSPVVYLPHHGVIKESSSTTKLRTVFDASSKTDSGVALNDVLHVGPTLQKSLIEIVIRFRFHNVALTGDLRKMYRQVIVHPDDRDYQRILWRSSFDDPIQEFHLNTVTYGEASSAYLAIKCIRQLADQAKHEYPIASRVILDEFYVDDIMTGAKDVPHAIVLQQQLEELMRRGGFEVHKWCSNRPESIEHVPIDRKEGTSKLSIDANDTIKTLGLEWNPISDQFQFSVHGTESATTKRQILSAISKFFDPLGLVGPILTTAKIMMQETWRIECNWDEPLSESFVESWEKFRRDLNSIETFLIPRRVIICQNPQRVYLQGFCDASESAYGACLYIQAEDEGGKLTSRLLCSKSRVAPIKPTSIPRLELCSAVLLARLIPSVQGSLLAEIAGVRAWSDSKVALCWIRGDASRWKTFVSNRVTEIVEILPADNWDHVKGSENPADLISRGTSPLQLKHSELWWSGPHWLCEHRPTATVNSSEPETSREIQERIEVEERNKSQACHAVNCGSEVLRGIIDRFSSLTKIERTLAYCRRYVANLKKLPKERSIGRLSTTELTAAHLCLINYVQTIHFSAEIAALKNQKELRSSSKLIQLRPFLGDQDVLRLLFEREHLRLLHASQTLLLSAIKELYWPLKGRSLARKICHNCVWCARNNPRELSQVMGALPSDRVTPSRPFTVTGVDFAGPITTLVNKGRGRKTNKSYIALFVCFTTKAIHLEATSELTTAAFLATLRRFIGRRVIPQRIFSDNATNFVGANRALQEIHKFVQTQVQENPNDELTGQGIDWQFIPANSPHMGGLWEAGVKSCKYHLKRVMGNALFTFEELSTVLAQIEACLNSRPLSAMSTDPMDLLPLTPAHFLIGSSLVGLPDTDVTDVSINHLDRWQLIQRVFQDFWKRWAVEYVPNLQGRSKWKTSRQNLKINDFVVLREENLPPLKWKLGRVIELHPGSDDQVRVVTIRTSTGNFKRAITKLCKLPIDTDSEYKISCSNLVGGMSDDTHLNFARSERGTPAGPEWRCSRE